MMVCVIYRDGIQALREPKRYWRGVGAPTEVAGVQQCPRSQTSSLEGVQGK